WSPTAITSRGTSSTSTAVRTCPERARARGRGPAPAPKGTIMSEKNDTFNPFDPTGLFQEMRSNGMDAWSKMMIQLVNTEAYAKATGVMLDAWLRSSVPFRKATETVMTQVLTAANMPTRADVIALAERLTNIERRLDDLEAKLEENSRPPRKAGGGKAKPGA